VTRGRIHRFRVARSRAGAAAIVRRAEMRAAFEDLARNCDFRQTRIVAVLLTSAAGIYRDATRLRRVGFMSGRPPIRAPLPDIPDHVVEAVAVWRECRYWRGARVAIAAEIFVRKGALPCIRHLLAARREFVTPSEFGAVEAAACGKFPFRFSRQILAGSLA
jgi:hypothetical protein